MTHQKGKQRKIEGKEMELEIEIEIEIEIELGKTRRRCDARLEAGNTGEGGSSICKATPRCLATMKKWQKKGRTGTGMCSKKCQAGRWQGNQWVHRYKIAQASS